jgi:hypothetical protein
LVALDRTGNVAGVTAYIRVLDLRRGDGRALAEAESGSRGPNEGFNTYEDADLPTKPFRVDHRLGYYIEIIVSTRPGELVPRLVRVWYRAPR